jgi:hypothetical protein
MISWFIVFSVGHRGGLIDLLAVMPREGGASSNHRAFAGYWIARLRGR